MILDSRLLKACILANSIACAQGLPPSPQTSASASPTKHKSGSFEEGRELYFKAMKEFIDRYAPTPASCTEIVEAALAGCDTIIDHVMRRMGTWDLLTAEQHEKLTNQFRENARRIGMLVALQAKYPHPENHKPQLMPSNQNLTTPTQAPQKNHKKE